MMTWKRISIGFGLVLALIFLFGAAGKLTSTWAAAPALQMTPEKPPLPTATPIQAEVEGQPQSLLPAATEPPAEQAIRLAFQQRIDDSRQQAQVLATVIFDIVIDRIEYSQDQSTALLWLAMRDTQTGEVLANEPGLSIAHIVNTALPQDASSWQITLQSDSDWQNQLQGLPADLLTETLRAQFLETSAGVVPSQPFSGYKLPWTAGVAKKVTNSVGHVYAVSGGYASCPTTCLYAFDFADGTMFPMLAAKGGTVKAYRLNCANGDSACTNYLVLEDPSTIPTTYQLYYHMANNSLPQRLRSIGAVVSQGEYIGDADDTGNSTGHHLHYHVYTAPSGANYSWGSSVDITFADVPVNGGRPRMCTESAQYPNLGAQCMPNNKYTSGNTPAHPPSGSLDQPADQQVLTGSTVTVSGSAADDIQIVRIQVVVNYDGTWKPIDDIQPGGDGRFSKEVDLCGSGIPDGPFGLTVRIYDKEGSLAPGIRVARLIKNSKCGEATPPPVPACVPDDNQVALFADPDFRGACTTVNLNPSGYPSDQLGPVGSDNAASIQVGRNVLAVLYDRSEDVTSAVVSGRVETLAHSDAGLADNRIGANTLSGIAVMDRMTPPREPFIHLPIGNRLTAGSNPSSLDSLVFAWAGAAGATSFEVTLTGPNTNWTQTTPNTSLSVGTLAAGSYTLQVKAVNAAGSNSSAKTFTVSAGSLPAATASSVPYLADFEGGPGSWVATGLWRYGTIDIGGRGPAKSWIYNNGSNINDPTWQAGDLTSPPINIPAIGKYYLKFNYFADGEDGYPHWDQRRVQISINGGPFADFLQLTDDKQAAQVWLNSGPLSLAEFAGKTIRLRFHFDVVDEARNTGKGWMVDDVTINDQGPETGCADQNNTPGEAQVLRLGSAVSGTICPQRDVDYFTFTGKAGQAILADIDARTLKPASKLDSHLFLLDADGASVIAENDDEQYSVLVDSLLPFTLSRDGTYYLKLMPWNYPGAGGSAFTYQLSLKSPGSSVPPRAIYIDYPLAHDRVPTMPFEILVHAADFDDGPVSQVEFYWHGPDWNNPAWVKLGTDTTAADGWTWIVDPLAYGNIPGSALYVQARGRLGGVLSAVLWDLQPDETMPASQLEALPGLTNSTAIELKWAAVDPGGDIDHFNLQYQVNGGAWQDWTEGSLPGNSRSAWFMGTAGSRYGFRLRAVDQAGNAEVYQSTAETTTQFAPTCAPDPLEVQNQTSAGATNIPVSTISAVFNLCKSAQSGAGDEDWIAMSVQKGKPQLVMVLPRSGGAGFKVSLYNTSLGLLKTWQSPTFQSPVIARWDAPSTGTYYVKIEPFRPGLFGTEVNYQLVYGPGNWFYLPIIGN